MEMHMKLGTLPKKTYQTKEYKSIVEGDSESLASAVDLWCDKNNKGHTRWYVAEKV